MKQDELVGVCHDKVILSTSDLRESLSPMNYSATLILFLYNPSNEQSGMDAFFEEG